MKLILLICTFLAGACGLTGTARGQAASDSVVTVAVPRTLIPVRLRHDGVRIRSIHDNRRVVILRPPMRVILPGPVPVAAAPSATMPTVSPPTLPISDELALMELRLMDYLDRRLRVMESRLAATGSAAVSSPPVVVVQGSPPGGSTTLLPTPSTPVTETVIPDSVGVDSLGLAPVVADSVATPPTGGVRPFTIDPTSTVVEVERAILDNDLLRTTSVLFESNSAAILPASASVLNTLGIVLQRHPEIRLEVGGHSDSRGQDEYNMQLSLERATAVRDYLLGNYAIDPARLTAQGFGETRPIADDVTATGRTMNRRVEFMLIR